ncbi:MAG: outer membrane protein assembly complex, YaeT protein [Gemmatimonadetes bacterium]|nr:outer membrane protein assembly complex, YaeT protein [Gemmatimonadota bacterium]
MRRPLLFALLPLLAAPVAARAQDAVTGPCATPSTIVFRGNARITEAMLRADVGIAAGTTLNYRELQRAIKNLYATAQFEDVQALCEAAADGKTTLAFVLRERPLLTDVTVSGVSRLSAGTVKDRVDLLIGRPVDPAQVARSIARIDSLYESNGYYLASVRAETTLVAGGAKVNFAVDEGHRLAISGIRLSGNKAVSAKDIVAAMKTKPEGFLWWKAGAFDEDAFNGDLSERLPALYSSRGFIDMQITRDTLVIDRARGKGLIEVHVNEGPQYRIGAFEVNGAKRFSSDELQRYYPFGERTRTLKETVGSIIRPKKGIPANAFDRSRWDAATQKVQSAYANEGYIYASVRPVIERSHAADSVPTVNLRWEIDERTPAIINRVDIVGNEITNESCIRDQILMLPGDVYNQDLLYRSYQSIGNLGFFETPLPAPDTKAANDQGDVDIVFRVKEKHTGNVNFGASVGQGTGVGGFIGFDQPNLFGKCKRGSLQWQFGRYINDFNLSYTDPRIRESQISGTVSAYHTQSRYVIRDIGRSIRTGGSIRIGFPVPGSRYTRLFVDYGGEKVAYGQDGLVSTISCSSCFRSTLGLTADRDTRLDMPFPSMGAHQTFTAQFNGGPLGGTASFQRFTGELRGYSTLAAFGGSALGTAPIKLVAGLSTRMGALFGNSGPFFVSQEFSLGGVQYGEPLRGYEEFSITPSGYLSGSSSSQAQRASFGNAFYTTTAELGLRFNQQVYLDAFYDAGNIWERPQDFNPTRLFRGAGVGAALVTPLGPLGVDLGYGFDRVDEAGRRAPKWQVHFKFGQFF